MWLYIMLAMQVATVASAAFLVSRVCRFAWTERLSGGKRWLRLLLAAVPVALLLGGLWLWLGSFNAMVILIHLLVFWALCDLVSFIVTRVRKVPFRCYYAGALALTVTALYIGAGWYLAHNVWRTGYGVTATKDVGDLRVALIADAHVGTTFDGAGFARWMERVQSDAPDVMVVAGDFVDDDTSRADMEAACRALGEMETRYGVYYVFGNHDKGYYGDDYRGYSADDLAAELEKNGVGVLQDESVLLGDRFYLVGRKDRSEVQRGGSRRSVAELVEGLDTSKYIIVADHQPQEFDAEAQAGVDLVLSGHTHGGWLFPMNYITRWSGDNDMVYGLERRGGTTFVTTSGISDWAMQFRTGCRAEYVIVDIQGQ